MNTVNVHVQPDRTQSIVLELGEYGPRLYLTVEGAQEISEKLQQAIQDLTMKLCEGCEKPFTPESMVYLHDAGYSVCDECYGNDVHNCSDCGAQWLQADMITDADYNRFCPLHDPVEPDGPDVFDALKVTI